MWEQRRVADSTRPTARPVVFIAVVVLLAVACGTSGPTMPPGPGGSPTTAAPVSSSPTPSASAAATPFVDPSTVYRTIEGQVVEIRGLHPKAPVTPTILDDAGIKKLIADTFKKDNPPDVMAATERIMKALGLLPEAASLTDLYIRLLGSQVAGLYSPDNKKLFVVSKSGGLGPIEKVTFSHEFTHALQDQNFNLGSLRLDEVGQGDRSFARLSLVEGDATLTMTNWEISHLSQAELGQILAGTTSNDLQTLMSMPPILRESLLFPYTLGLGFVQGLQSGGGWAAVDAAFADPPASTEQIIHPDKYAAREAPVDVEMPKDLATRLGAGWKITFEDSFGEFQMQVWLKQNQAIPAATAVDAAAGWGGDRLALVEGPSGAWGVILRTVWDSDDDAAAFERAAADYVEQLPSPAGLIPAHGPERWILIASDQDTLHFLASALELGS
jgi:hypothetical protein